MWSLRGGKLPVSGLSHCVDGGFIYWKRILERGKEREKKKRERHTEKQRQRLKERRGEEKKIIRVQLQKSHYWRGHKLWNWRDLVLKVGSATSLL